MTKLNRSIRNVNPLRMFPPLLLAAVVLSSAGCNYLPWPDSFGAVTPPQATRSLNGLGVHKRMWESAGTKVLTPQKLSPRLEDFDVLVLAGSTYRPPGKLARDWLEEWLSEQQGRTVVYFGRDFDAELLYREQTIDEVSATSRKLASDAMANREAKQFAERLEQNPEDIFCRWFFLRTSAQPVVHRKFTGEWASSLEGSPGEWPVTTSLDPPVRKLKSKKPSWLAPGATPKATPINPFSPSSDATEELGEKEVQRSIWQPEEISTDEIWQKEWKSVGSSEVLLAGANSEPLVHRITSTEFPRSQILVVANGAPFLNGTMVIPLHRKIGELIIEECLPATRVGLVAYDENGLLISQIDTDGNANAGLELLTVWPLSAITMHAAFLGIIVCTVLLPILGRPQSLPKRSVTDFGLHVEAMGQMLFESRDMGFAVRTIRDYFSKVRGEKPPEWLTEMEVIEPLQINRALAAAKGSSGPALNAKLTVPPTLRSQAKQASDASPVASADSNRPTPTDKPPIDPLS